MTKNSQRIALVTGATGGLGTHICKRLHDDGDLVCANYRSEEKARAWQEQMQSEGYAVHLYKADVADYDEVGAMVEKIAADHGTIDVLVNNAGITRDGAFRKMGKDAWAEVIAANLTSVFNCTRHVINPMIEQTYGRIINISSVNGQRAVWTSELCSRKGRDARHHQDAGHRGGHKRHHGKHHLAGLRSHRYGDGRARRSSR